MSIQTELARLTNAKAAIQTAIEGKGVTVPDGTLLDGMASLIESIEAGGGAKFVTGEFTLDTPASGVLVEHNLGNIPNFVYYYILAAPTTANQYETYATRLFAMCLNNTHYAYRASGGMSNKGVYFDSGTFDITKKNNHYSRAAGSANESTIYIGSSYPTSSYGYFKNAITYKWGVGVI